MKVTNSYIVYDSINLQNSIVDKNSHVNNNDPLAPFSDMDTFSMSGSTYCNYVLCDAINCDEDLCDIICDKVCDVVCDKVCDEWCDKVCDEVKT